MNKKSIFEIFAENQEYEKCNIEFEPLGGAEDGVDFRPVLDMQNQNVQLRKNLETLKSFIKGELQDCETICDILGIEFKTGLAMFDFYRTAEWNPAPLNGQKITTKFRPKEIELRGRLKSLELEHIDVIHRFQAQKYYHQDLRREMLEILLANTTETCRKKLIELVAVLFEAKVKEIYKNLDDKESVPMVGFRNTLDFVKQEVMRMSAREFYCQALREEAQENSPNDLR